MKGALRVGATISCPTGISGISTDIDKELPVSAEASSAFVLRFRRITGVVVQLQTYF